jgi:2-succinyl-5-enolpyruvyl-6-hydroxy-3-cyclohexene-1-carboxylate synthase
MTAPADRADVQATYVATLVDEWVRAGVSHAVVAPGSRSTPLALALVADGRIVVHVHHDERDAAFLALGVGLVTGHPAVVLTTSGTAAVELHPAVVEASQARVPMVVCTADRPPELQQVGAPQTVDQTRLFGAAARWFAEPGVAEADTAAAWRSLASRAVAEATGPVPGPVHLNLAFRDPLVGTSGPLPPGRPGGAPWHRAPRPPAVPVAELADVSELLAAGHRGVVVAGAGSGPAEAVHRLADHLAWPVLADPRSPARVPAPATVAAFDAVLRHRPFADAVVPEVVLRLGEPPASKVLGQWLAASGAVQVAVEATGRWFDADRTAAVAAAGDPGAWCDALAGHLPAGAGTAASWLDRWASAERAARTAIAGELSRQTAGGAVSEPWLAQEVVTALPDGATLVVASSMPVRDVEWYAAPRRGVRVVANRGANGIDGLVSTAVGAAVGTGAATTLLIGDVAFLHDANGLLELVRRDVDLTIVVVDNRGGGIFSFLPQASALPPERFELLFGTPHAVDLVALAAAYGVDAARAATADDVRRALAGSGEARRAPRVVVVPTERASNVADHDRIHAAVAAALPG